MKLIIKLLRYLWDSESVLESSERITYRIVILGVVMASIITFIVGCTFDKYDMSVQKGNLLAHTNTVKTLPAIP